jgi:N-acetyl sugar amidotransferase
MRYCTRCVYPANHPLNLVFDDDGVCSGCRVHEEKDQLEWGVRRERLGRLLDSYRSRSGSSYDCIIPVSGARDSWFIVHTIKVEFGMNPLLVLYNKHYNTRLGIRNFAYLRSWSDCDAVTKLVGESTVQRITRLTIKRLGSMYWHCLAGETVFPVETAVRFKVPLIIWGAHQGVDQVGMFSHLDEVEMTRKYRKDHDVMGVEAEDLVATDEGVSADDLAPFMYPHDKEIERVGVRGIYLNNYIRWDTKAQHEAMIARYGYETHDQARTFDRYNDVDSFHYSGLHDYIKFLKWGYGKVSDHASREIRLKRLSREQAIDLVRRYERIEPPDTPLFLDWVGLSPEEFWPHIDRHRDPRAWQRQADGRWTLLDSVTRHQNDDGVDRARLPVTGPCDFTLTPSREPDIADDNYVLFGKGHVDQEYA